MKTLSQKVLVTVSSYKKTTAISVFIVLFLILLPEIVKYSALHYLSKHGAESASIGDIDLNLFSGNFQIENLSLKAKGGSLPTSLKVLKSNFSMSEFLLGRISVENLFITGLELPIEKTEDSLIVGLPFSRNESETVDSRESAVSENAETSNKYLRFGLRHLEVNDSVFSYTDEKICTELRLKNLALYNLYSWIKNSKATITIDSEINSSPFAAEINARLFADEPEVESAIHLNDLQLQEFNGYIIDTVDRFECLLSCDMKLSWIKKQGRDVEISQSGYINFNKLKGIPEKTPAPVKLNNSSISFSGISHFTFTHETPSPLFRIEGIIENSFLDAEVGKKRTSVIHDGIKWSGTINNSADNYGKPDFTGNLVFNDLIVRDNSTVVKFISLSETGADKPDNKNITKVKPSQDKPVSASPEKISDKPLSNNTLSIKGIKLRPSDSLKISSIEISDTMLHMEKRDPDVKPLVGSLSSFVNSFKTQGGNSKKTVERREKEKSDLKEDSRVKPMKLNIGSISASGNNILSIDDKSVKPSYTKQISVKKLSIKNVNNINQESEVKIDIHLTSGRHASATLSGTAKPFGIKTDMDIKAEIKDVDLVSLSPYFASQTGYNIKTGTMKADIRVNVKDDILDVQSDLILNKMKLVPNETGIVDKVIKTITVPLDYVLSILRDKNDNVELSIPVTGDLNNPDFNLGDIYGKALFKAAKAASVSIVKTLLQPYGALISLTQMAATGGKFITKMRLDSVQFQTGSSILDEKGKAYLSTIAKLLREKKNLRLSICGLATTKDIINGNHETNPDPYIRLARKRRENVSVYLESIGVPHDRLFDCNAEVDIDENAVPRVDLSI